MSIRKEAIRAGISEPLLNDATYPVVLNMLQDGLPTRTIAQYLGITVVSMRARLKNMRRLRPSEIPDRSQWRLTHCVEPRLQPPE